MTILPACHPLLWILCPFTVTSVLYAQENLHITGNTVLFSSTSFFKSFHLKDLCSVCAGVPTHHWRPCALSNFCHSTGIFIYNTSVLCAQEYLPITGNTVLLLVCHSLSPSI